MSTSFGPTRRDFLKTGLPLLAGSLVKPAELFAQGSLLVSPFIYHAPQSALDDLRRRIHQAIWPEREPVNDSSQGVQLEKLRSVVDYWESSYDWRKAETALNRFAQFRTEIDGLGFHFIHVRSRHANAMPIILTHGWPSTVQLFRDVIGPLTDPTAHGGHEDEAFHVVVPSLPGFGFSDKPKERGWNAERTAKAWAQLMQRLQYSKYIAQGGDWGAYVTIAMAQQRPAGLVAIHLNFPQVIPDQIPKVLTPEQKKAVDILTEFKERGSGYFAIQSTRPQTIGYALGDSPVGLAAWIYDITQRGPNNQIIDVLSRDTILDEITLYWLTGTATSSARMYFEQVALLGKHNNPGRVELPVGCSVFPNDLPAPRSWADAVYPHLIYWRELDRGGHFAALELPMVFTNELRAFARAVRKL